MTALLVGLLVCVGVAVTVIVLVALPHLREGSPILTPEGERLAEEARRFTLANSELRAAIDKIVTWVSWGLIPAAIGLMWSQLRVPGRSIDDALVAAVAGMVADACIGRGCRLFAGHRSPRKDRIHRPASPRSRCCRCLALCGRAGG